MSADLRVLAERYVTLTGEVEAVRRSMLACLTNGAGEHFIRPTQPARSSGGSHPNAIVARQAEEPIFKLLQDQPGMRAAELARATGDASRTR